MNPFFWQLAQAAGLPEDMVNKQKQSRAEKKARKIMGKLGLKQVQYLSFIASTSGSRADAIRIIYAIKII